MERIRERIRENKRERVSRDMAQFNRQAAGQDNSPCSPQH